MDGAETARAAAFYFVSEIVEGVRHFRAAGVGHAIEGAPVKRFAMSRQPSVRVETMTTGIG